MVFEVGVQAVKTLDHFQLEGIAFTRGLEETVRVARRV